jgi:two-component system, sensor histidine kinase RegB
VRMAEVRRRAEAALARVRERELANGYMLRVGTLATSAAHELGTPLATIAVLSKDLADEYGDNPDLAEKMRTLRQQVGRCKDALSVITAEAGVPRAEGEALVAADAYLENLVESWRKSRPGVAVTHRFEGSLPAPGVAPQPGLGQAILNVLNNAADAAKGLVALEAHWTATELTMEVSDRGPGFSGDALAAATEPFFSTKEGGMGLGLFVAKAVIDQLGGTLYLGNRAEGGAIARITIPLNPSGAPS